MRTIALTLGAGLLAAAVLATPAAASVVTPKLYTVVRSAPTTALPGGVTGQFADCPAGTAPWGGGVRTSSTDLAVNAGSSIPYVFSRNSTGWFAQVTNHSASAVTIQTEAVCATRPRRYAVVQSGWALDPFSRAAATTLCPAGTVVLGGGGAGPNDFRGISVDINTTRPVAGGWTADFNNRGGAQAYFTVAAICGLQPRKGYSVAISPVAANPAGRVTSVSQTCPAGVPISGGVLSGSTSTSVNVASSFSFQQGWTAAVSNASSVDATLRTYAICAGSGS